MRRRRPIKWIIASTVAACVCVCFDRNFCYSKKKKKEKDIKTISVTKGSEPYSSEVWICRVTFSCCLTSHRDCFCAHGCRSEACVSVFLDFVSCSRQVSLLSHQPSQVFLSVVNPSVCLMCNNFVFRNIITHFRVLSHLTCVVWLKRTACLLFV